MASMAVGCRDVSELSLDQLTYLVLSNNDYLTKIFLGKVVITVHSVGKHIHHVPELTRPSNTSF